MLESLLSSASIVNKIPGKLNGIASAIIRKYKKKESSKWVLILPSTVFLTIFLLIPAILLLQYSFRPYVAGNVQTGWTIANYLRGITESPYQTYLFRSLRIAFFTTVLTFLLGFPIAYAAVRRGGLLGTAIVMSALAPLTIDLVIRTFGWYVLFSQGGVVQTVLAATPFFTDKSAPSLLFSEPAVIIGMTHVMLPYMVFPIISVLHTIQPSLEEAARDLGANRFKVFSQIIFPMSLPGVSAGILIVFLATMSSYVTPKMLGGNYTVLATELARLITSSNNWAFASALSALLIVIAVLFIVLYNRAQLMIKKQEGM